MGRGRNNFLAPWKDNRTNSLSTVQTTEQPSDSAVKLGLCQKAAHVHEANLVTNLIKKFQIPQPHSRCSFLPIYCSLSTQALIYQAKQKKELLKSDD